MDTATGPWGREQFVSGLDHGPIWAATLPDWRRRVLVAGAALAGISFGVWLERHRRPAHAAPKRSLARA